MLISTSNANYGFIQLCRAATNMSTKHILRNYFRTRVREDFLLSHYLSFKVLQDYIHLYPVTILMFPLPVIHVKETLR